MQFTPEQTPSEVLNMAGERLAIQLGDEFRWVKTRQAVLRIRGVRQEEIRLQPSKWNRAGIGTWATVRLTVRDKALATWRRSHPERYAPRTRRRPVMD